MRPEKTHTSLCIRAFWSESSQNILLVAEDPKHLQADTERFWSVYAEAKAYLSIAGRTCSIVANACPQIK